LSCTPKDDNVDIDPFESYRYELCKKMLDDGVEI